MSEIAEWLEYFSRAGMVAGIRVNLKRPLSEEQLFLHVAPGDVYCDEDGRVTLFMKIDENPAVIELYEPPEGTVDRLTASIEADREECARRRRLREKRRKEDL